MIEEMARDRERYSGEVSEEMESVGDVNWHGSADRQVREVNKVTKVVSIQLLT